eukprot:TRINITY_DN4564_c0_g1_i1.p2 TRINITY_DN4564_c0_g1~~TRINITY_DN4564_c0_g1_i1.p2  ORF type:complete len:113 (-),score=5.51 TRINITY_DN4564_c0_g1_i1:226-564(-)
MVNGNQMTCREAQLQSQQEAVGCCCYHLVQTCKPGCSKMVSAFPDCQLLRCSTDYSLCSGGKLRRLSTSEVSQPAGHWTHVSGPRIEQQFPGRAPASLLHNVEGYREKEIFG